MIRKNNCIEIPIEAYANKLRFYLENYLNMVDMKNMQQFSKKETEQTKVILKWLIFENNNKELKKNFKYIENKIDYNIIFNIRQYTKCIMKLLGELAECMIVDRCTSNKEFNKILINIAMFKKDIYKTYSDIAYDEYIAFSTSFKYVFF